MGGEAVVRLQDLQETFGDSSRPKFVIEFGWGGHWIFLSALREVTTRVPFSNSSATLFMVPLASSQQRFPLSLARTGLLPHA